MSKRNLILFIIVLIIIVIGIFGFLYFNQPKNQTSGTSTSTNFFSNFFPFGKSTNTSNTNSSSSTNISGTNNGITIGTPNAKLRKVSSFPIAGFGVFNRERLVSAPIDTNPANQNPVNQKPITPSTEFMPALRYVEKTTGLVYEAFADKLDERKFSSTIIPKLYDAYLGNNGDSVLMRYLKTDNSAIETFAGTLPKEILGVDLAQFNTIKGSFLPENISDISISPDNSEAFYIFNIEDAVVGVTFSLQNSTKIQVFDSPFTGWLSSWPNNKIITVTTKPSANIPGYMYTVNPDKKDFNKVLGGINGLTTLMSPDGKMVLYGDNNLSLNLFDTSTKNSTLLGIKTLPEKCVWGFQSDVVYCAVPKYIDQGEYPDSWYQGEASFKDQIWKIDIKSGSTIVLSDLSESSGQDIDAVKLSLDQDQNYLFFINKKDSYLWELNLK